LIPFWRFSVVRPISSVVCIGFYGNIRVLSPFVLYPQPTSGIFRYIEEVRDRNKR